MNFALISSLSYMMYIFYFNVLAPLSMISLNIVLETFHFL